MPPLKPAPVDYVVKTKESESATSGTPQSATTKPKDVFQAPLRTLRDGQRAVQALHAMGAPISRT